MAAGAEATDEAAGESNIAAARQQFTDSLSDAVPFSVLAENAGLSAGEAEVLAVSAAVEADPRLQVLAGFAQSDTSTPRLTLNGLMVLFPGDHIGVRAVGPDGALRRAGLIDVVDDGPWANHVVRVHPSVMWALAGDASADPDLPVGTELRLASESTGDEAFVVVTGPDRVRRQQEATRVAAGDRFVIVPHPSSEAEWAATVREATIVGAGIIVELDEELPIAGRRWIERARHLSWVLSSRVEVPMEQMPDRAWIDRHVAATEPTGEEWAEALGDAPRSHRLTADQLQFVQRAYAATGGDLDAAVRRLAGGHIDRLARRVRPTRGWTDIVMSPDRIQALRELVARAHHGDTVYEEWGFSATPSRGLVALFSGASGTGKTLAAEIIAGELGLDLFKLDLSAVVSKYIGETEKNLDRVFDAASAGNVVLFFDEADALFGKRSEVHDARDRYANIEVSYLLQRLESYDGLVVLATNFERNIDEAFVRRIQCRIQFPLPDEAERKAIWEHNFPPTAPLAADVDTAFLARQFEMSGGSIRNAALQSAFLAAAREKPIEMESVIVAVAREYQKQGRLLDESDFGPHYHLVVGDESSHSR